MTAGIYSIINSANKRVYVGSSRNIEKRLETHFDDLRRHAHHSWKLQADWGQYGEKSFTIKTLHKFDLADEHLELQLEIFERSEVIGQRAVLKGYNVSDEIIRDTSLVLKHCDDTISSYLRENGRKFLEFNKSYPKNAVDIEQCAYEYLEEHLVNLFIKCGLSTNESNKLSFGYVVDAKKMRIGGFKYWRE